nr:Alpha-1 3/1 6-mannosyltransferase alg-2 [Polyrhizophydium stewartii]
MPPQQYQQPQYGGQFQQPTYAPQHYQQPSYSGYSQPRPQPGYGAPPSRIGAQSPALGSPTGSYSHDTLGSSSGQAELLKEREEKRRLDEALTARLADISRLEADLRRARQEQRDLEDQIVVLMKNEDELRELRTAVASKSKEIEQLRSRIAAGGSLAGPAASANAAADPDAARRIQELEQALAAEQAQTKALRLELDEAGNAGLAAAREKRELVDRMEALKLDAAKAAEMRSVGAADGGEAAQLRQELDAARAENSRNAAVVAELRSKISELEAAGGAHTVLADQFAAERRKLLEQIVRLEASVAKADAAAADADTAAAASEAKLKELDSLRETLKAQTAKFDAERDLLMERIAAAERDAARNNIALAEFRTKATALEDISRHKDAEMEEIRGGLQAAMQKKDSTIAMLTESLNQQAAAAKADFDNLTARLHQEIQAKDQALMRLSQVPPDPFSNWTRNTVAATGPPKPPPPVPRGVEPEIWAMFCRADPYQTKRLDAGQLEIALSAGPWPPLSIRTIVFLIRTYDRNGDFVDFEFFERIWPELHKWKSVFFKYHNGTGEFVFGYVPTAQMRAALKEIGITVPSKVLELVFRRLHLRGDLVSWDDFVGLAARFRAEIHDFDRVDTDKDKAITILYDQYMDMVNRCAF